MEAGNRANKSGVKPIQEAAILPVKLQYLFFMKHETAQVKTATYNSWRQKLSSIWKFSAKAINSYLLYENGSGRQKLLPRLEAVVTN